MYSGYTEPPTQTNNRIARQRIAGITGQSWYGRSLAEMQAELPDECSCNGVTGPCPVCQAIYEKMEVPF